MNGQVDFHDGLYHISLKLDCRSSNTSQPWYGS